MTTLTPQKLTYFRKQFLNLSQTQLGELLNCSGSRIAQLESGKIPITPEFTLSTLWLLKHWNKVQQLFYNFKKEVERTSEKEVTSVDIACSTSITLFVNVKLHANDLEDITELNDDNKDKNGHNFLEHVNEVQEHDAEEKRQEHNFTTSLFRSLLRAMILKDQGSPTRVAQYLGVSKSTVGRWLTGEMYPSASSGRQQEIINKVVYYCFNLSEEEQGEFDKREYNKEQVQTQVQQILEVGQKPLKFQNSKTAVEDFLKTRTTRNKGQNTTTTTESEGK